MRRLTAVLLISLLAACHQSTEKKPADDSLAAKAGDAGLRARKKAEALKAAEDKKAKEANEAMDNQ